MKIADYVMSLTVLLLGGKIFVKPIQAAYFLTNCGKAIRLFFHKWRFFCHSCQAADLTLISGIIVVLVEKLS
jgi:hypothetical protein